MANQKQNIILIGAGNLASHLALALTDTGYTISQIYSRTQQSAETLANTIGCDFTTRIEAIKNDADIFIFAIKDSILSDFLIKLNVKNKFFVHTAGSVPLDIFKDFTNDYGVFYPMQTFSKNKSVEFKHIPIFTEASTISNLSKLDVIAQKLSNKVVNLDSDKRKMLHVAAVFSSNFTNHMYAIAEQILCDAGLSFNLMLPLIEEVADKVKTLAPKDAQTGPAMRYDEDIINKHLDLLNTLQEEKEIYKLISKNIHRKNN